MKTWTRAEIERALPGLDLVERMESAFVEYSQGRAVVGPVSELVLPGGDVHVKTGYLRDGDRYVVKIASGFYANPELGLSSSNGLMLLFDQKTGVPVAALFDEGALTDARTAAAGAVAARALANRPARRIGVFGTGIQARLQLAHLRAVNDCRRVTVWGRSDEGLARYAAAARELGFEVETSRDGAAVAASTDLIVTATPATEPLFPAAAVRPGTHVTAVGSDTPEKQELDPELLALADHVVADSRAQCRERGEIHRAIAAGRLAAERVVELGEVLTGKAPGRQEPGEVTVADLTGLGVQDLAIACAVDDALLAEAG